MFSLETTLTKSFEASDRCLENISRFASNFNYELPLDGKVVILGDMLFLGDQGKILMHPLIFFMFVVFFFSFQLLRLSKNTRLNSS